MRDPARIDPFLKELGELWKLFPDMRFGQLVQNIPTLGGGGGMVDNWYWEEKDWLELIGRAKIAGAGINEAMEEYNRTQADTEERYADSDPS